MSNFIFTKEQLEWIEALESGEYKQCRSVLYDPKTDGFCCLGLACKLNGVLLEDDRYRDGCVNQNLSASLETTDVMNRLHLRDANGCGGPDQDSLTSLNDYDGVSFPSIAARLRAHPEAYFSQGAES